MSHEIGWMRRYWKSIEKYIYIFIGPKIRTFILFFPAKLPFRSFLMGSVQAVAKSSTNKPTGSLRSWVKDFQQITKRSTKCIAIKLKRPRRRRKRRVQSSRRTAVLRSRRAPKRRLHQQQLRINTILVIWMATSCRFLRHYVCLLVYC